MRTAIAYAATANVRPSGFQMPAVSQGKVKKSYLGIACLIALVICNVIDLNRFATTFLGINRGFSMIYLFLCVAVCIIFRLRLRSSLGRAGAYYVAFFLTFLLISTVIRLIDFNQFTVFVSYYYLRMYGAALLITLSVALGVHHLFQVFSWRKAIWILFLMLSVQMGGMAFGAAFGERVFGRSEQLGQKAQKMAQQGRQMGLFGDPNQAGMFLASAAAVGFPLLIVSKTSFEQGIVFAMLGGLTVCMIGTFSRSVMITLMLLALAQVWISPVLRKRSAMVFGLVLFGGMIWFITVGYTKIGQLNELQSERIADLVRIFEGDIREETTGQRFLVAANGLRFWAESPVFGHGIGSGGYLADVSGIFRTVGPHNQLIRVGVESGIIGFSLYAVAIIALAWRGWRCRNPAVRNLVLGYLVVYFCSVMTLHTVLTDNVPAVMLGICFAALATVDVQSRLAMRQRRMVRTGPPAAAV